MNEAHERAVKAFLEYFHTDTLDLKGIKAALAPNARWQPIVPLSAPMAGPDAIAAELERQYKMYDDCSCKILSIASNGKQVFTERVDTCRMLADGRTVRVSVTGVFDVDQNNRITFWREYWDALDCAGQLGIDDKMMRGIMCAGE